MKKLTYIIVFAIIAIFLLSLIGCSKSPETPVTPVTIDTENYFPYELNSTNSFTISKNPFFLYL